MLYQKKPILQINNGRTKEMVVDNEKKKKEAPQSTALRGGNLFTYLFDVIE